MLKTIVIFFFLLVSNSSIASFTFSDNCKKAYTHVFNLDYEQANYLINVEKLYNPSNPSILFLESCISLMKSVLEEDPEAIKLFTELHQKFITAYDKEKEIGYVHKWLLSETYFHSALINFKTGNYLQGAWQLRKAYRTAQGATDENNPLPNKITGLTQTFLSTVPDEYQWVLKIFGMNGDLESGSKQLKKLLKISKTEEEYNFILPELLFYITYIEGNLLKNIENALSIIDEHKDEMTSPTGIYIHCSLLIKSGKSKKAGEILSDELYSKFIPLYPFPYMIYMLGLTKLYSLNYEAKDHFENYINHYKGNHFLKAANQKLAWIELLKNNLNGYKQYLDVVLKRGSKETDQDRQAHIEAEKKEIPHLALLKSRLLFDGGSYAEAEKLLSEIDLDNLEKKHLVEYYYRLGRLKQEQLKENIAEENFIRVITLQGDENYYYAPNAALQIAMISEENKNYKKAADFYRKAYSYKNYEYKNSIQQKAKAGLRRIQNI